jgi:hypothetical protein
MDLQGLTTRVEDLERQNRRLKRGLVAAGVVALGVAAMAQVVPLPDEVRTRRLVLIDQDGELRAEMASPNGVPVLTLRDAAGNVLVRLTGNGSRGVIQYRDHRGDLQDLAAPPGVRPLTRVQ